MLLIYANSDTMRKWLWQDFLNVKGMYNSSLGMLIGHAILSVVGIFVICIVIDQIRMKTVEKNF